MVQAIGGVVINISHKPQQPQKPYKNRFRLIGLRGKLLLATIALFILPIAGLSYLKELELFLKNNHAESTLVNAKTIASVFRNNASLVRLNRLTESSSPAIYCHSLQNKKIIDGFAGDWFTLQNRQQYFYPIQHANTADALAHKLSLLCVNDDQYYYFLLSVDKSSLEENKSFGQIGFIASKATDMIRFDFLNYARQIQSYEFKLQTSGWVEAQAISAEHTKTINPQITAQWQANNQGFNLEFKVPINGINSQLAFQFQQLTAQHIIKPLISSTHSINSFSSIQALNPIVTNDRLNTLKLQHLTPPNTRLWLLNKQHYINAKSTSAIIKEDKDNKRITESESNNAFSLLALYRRLYLIVMNYPQQQSIYGRNQAKIDNPFVQLNLQGKSSTDWLDNPHSDKMLLSVTTPVYDYDNRVIGSLVLEQNNDTLLALQDQTFERILYLTLLVFFTITLTLFFISSRLLKRIINLRNDTNLALSNDGHISNQLYRNDNDEIGDLARSFSTLLSRIEQNNEYLRSLSSKLSHELRTPLTIIKSSLENMDRGSLDKDNSKYSERAQEGCTRLNNLLNRMSEASRLEQSIDAMGKEKIEMVGFIRHYIDAQKATQPDINFQFQTDLKVLYNIISPELIAQLFDKLFSNAISFHKTGTPIILSLHEARNQQPGESKHTVQIELSNYGAMIDSDKLESIFTSLTSYRNHRSMQGHLGLGLYIASLISQFHQGHLTALNNKKEQSVHFIFSLPINE